LKKELENKKPQVLENKKPQVLENKKPQVLDKTNGKRKANKMPL
jgi:hypothetical protein